MLKFTKKITVGISWSYGVRFIGDWVETTLDPNRTYDELTVLNSWHRGHNIKTESFKLNLIYTYCSCIRQQIQSVMSREMLLIYINFRRRVTLISSSLIFFLKVFRLIPNKSAHFA